MAAERAEQAKVARSAGVVGMFTMLSRVVGLVRDQMFAHLFGATHATDAFIMAFTIPNTFRILVAEGSLTVAFLPVYAEARLRKGEEGARRLVAEALTLFPTLAVALVVLGMLLAEPLVSLYAQGFMAVPGKFELTTTLVRWMFPYLATMSVVALAMAVLNAEGFFASSAAAPAVFNVVHIGSMLFVAPYVTPTMQGVAYGVLAGGVAQVALQTASMYRAGRLVMPKLSMSPEIKRVILLMLPALGALAVYQVNIVVLRYFSSFFDQGVVTYLYNADRFIQLPLGIFGVALATASLPTLSEAFARGETPRALQTFNFAFRMSNTVAVGATTGLMVLALPIMVTVYQHGEFSHPMAQATARVLMMSAPGLLAISGIRIAAQVFFAAKDTRTPVLCSAIGLWANLALCPWLGLHIGFEGLALSVTLAAWLQLGVELWLLRSRLGRLGMRAVIRAGIRDIMAAAGMALPVWALATLGDWPAGLTVRNASVLLLAVGVGATAYLGLQVAMGSEEMARLLATLRRRVPAFRPKS